ncbi:MAG TPA: LexA family transcriptional regulator, partial [Klebsiella pneumoniae]|nr:LexA family transcriptional regulator [Klebsiella pneumoniae]
GRLPEQETPAQDAPAPSATAETSPAGDDAVPAAKARKAKAA